MKNPLKLFVALVAVSAGLGACQKPGNIGEIKGTVVFNAVSMETRTAFGTPSGTTYPTLWTSNDSKVKVSVNYGSAKNADVTPASDFKTATITADLTDPGTGPYVFYALSPASSYLNLTESYSRWNVVVPTTQTPSAKSVDEAAQILVAKSESLESWPTASVPLTFSHVTAYGHMSLRNLDLEGETIKSVSLTAAENWAGRYYYYIDANGSYAAGDVVPNDSGASKTITVLTSSTEDIWFACAPVDLGGKTIKVVVNTTGGTFTKTVTIPAGKVFASGSILKFGVDMSGVSVTPSVIYKRVNSLDDITVDSKVIIAAYNNDLAVSTTQSTNNRPSAYVSKSEDGSMIIDPAEDVQVVTLEMGTSSKTAAFKAGENYFYTSDNNRLLSKQLKASNCNWIISFSENIAVITSGEYSSRTLRYNSTDDVFATYTSGYGDLALYKLEGSGSSTKIFAEVESHIGEVYGTEGVIFWQDPADSKKVKIISAFAEKMAWAEFTDATGAKDDGESGVPNNEIVKTHPDYATKASVVKYCAGKGTGWYMPSVMELKALFEAYNGTSFSEATNANPDSITDAEKASRNAFETAMTSISGGVKINTQAENVAGDSIWACRETTTGTSGWYVRFGKVTSNNGTKSSTARFGRCVKVVTLN